MACAGCVEILWSVKMQFQKEMVHRIAPDNDLFLFDGIPIPTCNPKRVSYRNQFYGTGGFRYCAAKDKQYFGFKVLLKWTAAKMRIVASIMSRDLETMMDFLLNLTNQCRY
jgi:hypothetical protein